MVLAEQISTQNGKEANRVYPTISDLVFVYLLIKAFTYLSTQKISIHPTTTINLQSENRELSQ